MDKYIVKEILSYANYRCFNCSKLINLNNLKIIKCGSYVYCSKKCLHEFFLYA